MSKNKKKKEHITIEGQLEFYYRNDHHTERNAIMWHAWCQNKRWLSQMLETTMSAFPTYSRHDESHACTVIHNIEMILGENRIKELSASDCFMILHVVYIHDIGMVITHSDRESIVQNTKFIDMVQALENENDPVFQNAVKALQQRTYESDADISVEEQTKQLYKEKLDVYYALLHLIANFRRTEHGDISEKRLENWTLNADKLGAGFSMAGIPQRIFLLIAKCAGLHADSSFDHIMNLPQEDNGYVADYLHPRFVAVLLQLGDILDMDNDRFHPLTKECIGILPEISERHYEKHQSIRRLYIRPDIISIEADCVSQEALRLVRKECDILKEILKDAGYNWMLICPRNFSGALPTIDSVKLSLNGVSIPETLVATQFHISQKKAFDILEGSNVYKDRFVFLREFLQNAIDASKIQYWQECVRTRGYYKSKEELQKMSPYELEKLLSTDIFPIEVEMEIVKRDAELNEVSVTEEDIEELRKVKKTNWRYGVRVRIKDFGTGIDKNSILNIAQVGNSRKNEQYIIKDMPDWLKPTAEFGIGLQSAFILTNSFKCHTFTRSNEKYEITFSTVKSNYYDGYINVQPTEYFDGRDDVYGTCFEVFVPVEKKLSHELYPAAWDGKDYFDKDYAELRPLRHAAELMAQMVLYLDEQIGEQLFPIHLNVKPINGIEIPLNQTEKNHIRKLKHNLTKESEEYNDVKKIMDQLEDLDKKVEIEKVLGERKWFNEGKSWMFYFDKKEISELAGVFVERTDDSIGLLDFRDGVLYLWNNVLNVACIINMENFMRREKEESESRNKHCEHIERSVRIYYKGIELEKMELPDFGNEMIQSIDIKGKLERKYINLSRKGLTENGYTYFLDKIYRHLLKSISDILKGINMNQGEKLKESVKSVLTQKSNLLEQFTMLTSLRTIPFDEGGRILLKDDMRKVKKIQHQLEESQKKNLIFIVLLAFFAQMKHYNPLLRLSCGENPEDICHWSQLIDFIACQFAETEKNKETKKDEQIKNNEQISNSVLFHIKCRPEANLFDDKSNDGNTGNSITIADLFSEQKQFIIVSKRENASAPWKQYLTPIDISRKGNFGIIELLRQYMTKYSFSQEKEMMEKQILDMGSEALKLAENYGKNSAGTSGPMDPDEYLQQYFLKWMLQYIPTVALFVSEDGKIRVNVMHSKIFPFVFVNEAYKRMTIERILEEWKKYGIQRFSIPAWQQLEYLKCKKVPYSHYFVKRGFISRESYGKVLFPFGAKELTTIFSYMDSSRRSIQLQQLEQLFEVLNIRKYLTVMLNENPDFLEKIINDIEKNQTEGDENGYSKLYNNFKDEWKNGKLRSLSVTDNIRYVYREFIQYNLQPSKNKYSFNLERFVKNSDNWKRVYVCLLLKTLQETYQEITLSNPLELIREEDYQIIGAWEYLITGQYMEDVSEIIHYKKEYFEMLLMDGNETALRRKRMIEYIEENAVNTIEGDNIKNCWKKYEEEILESLVNIEMKEFIHPEERLPDYAQIKKAYEDYLEKLSEKNAKEEKNNREDE